MFTFIIPVHVHPDPRPFDMQIDFRDNEFQPVQQETNCIRFSGERVLFAEDNEINQIVAKEDFQRCLEAGMKTI